MQISKNYFYLIEKYYNLKLSKNSMKIIHVIKHQKQAKYFND